MCKTVAWWCCSLTPPACPPFSAPTTQDVSNSKDKLYKGRWVADVQVVHPNAAAIRGYLKLSSQVGGSRAVPAAHTPACVPAHVGHTDTLRVRGYRFGADGGGGVR